MMLFKATATYRKQYNNKALYTEELAKLESLGIVVENRWYDEDTDFFNLEPWGYIYIDIIGRYDHSELDTLQEVKHLAYEYADKVQQEAQHYINPCDGWVLLDCPVNWQVCNCH